MLLEKIYRVREFINIRLYRHKSYVLKVLPGLSFLVSLTAIAAIIYYYGFPITDVSFRITHIIISGSFIFYLLKYLLTLFYDFHPLSYIRNNWFEGIIMLILLIDTIGLIASGDHLVRHIFQSLNLENFTFYYLLFIQSYFFIIIAIEIGKASQHLALFKLSPSSLLALSFMFIILSGTGLLILPQMTTNGIRLIDALFVSTSACCVTGLTPVDISTVLTLKGKVILMILIQLGGINIISFATFFATFYGRSSGLQYQYLLKDLVTEGNMSDTRKMLQRIILFSLVIELIGAAGLFLTWPAGIFKSIPEHIFYSLFHSVSAFNNAGFSLFTDNLYDITLRYSYGLHMIIAVLIILGGLGFMALEDIFGIRNIRNRWKYPWKNLHIGTRVAIYTSFLLIISGTIMFYFLERNNSLAFYDNTGAFFASVFQSVTPRTAGFNTIDYSQLGQPILIFTIFLMFIGASPGGTGGGIKTNTFTIIFKSAIGTITGRKNIELLKHSISFDLVDKSYSIALFSLSLIFSSVFLLTLTDGDFPFLNLIFEEVSAFGTVGLSTGITPLLSDPGKIIIILSMFVGRIGTLTMALALTKKVSYRNYRYSEANIMIG